MGPIGPNPPIRDRSSSSVEDLDEELSGIDKVNLAENADAKVRAIALNSLNHAENVDANSLKGRGISVLSGLFQIGSGSLTLVKNLAGALFSPLVAAYYRKTNPEMENLTASAMCRSFLAGAASSLAEITIGGIGGIAGAIIHPKVGQASLKTVESIEEKREQYEQDLHDEIQKNNR